VSTPLHSWLPPRCDSRTGASHRRRDAPCQDASGVWSFLDGAGQPVQALVVSDGHGGSRYDRSAVGSRIACQVALAEVQQVLCGARLNQADAGEHWLPWLRDDLPGQIVERWRMEVLAHARAHPRADGAPPSTLAYGATLGLLLLTPDWWGYSGLGDWDLARISGDGSAALISEEPDHPGGGEATYSLCMEGAARWFAPRCGLMPISAGQPPFSLLLSTDGIRKSCGTDADYLTLARYLCELPASPGDPSAEELDAALDHISSQGSGDDVSVAIGRWGRRDAPQGMASPGDRSPGVKPRHHGGPVIVQPGLEAPAAAPGQTGDPAADAPPASATGKGLPSPSHRKWGQPERKRPALWLLRGVGVLGLSAAGVGAAAVLGWGPFDREGSETERQGQELAQALQHQAAELCGMHEPSTGAAMPAAAPDGGSPGTSSPPPAAATHGNSPDQEQDPALLSRISATLTMRKSIVLGLLNGTMVPAAFLADPTRDPLSTLIAWSSLQAQLNPSVPPVRGDSPPGQGLDWWPGWLAPQRTAPQPHPQLCPELRLALQNQWKPQRLGLPLRRALPLRLDGHPAVEPLAAPHASGSAEPPSQR